MASAVADLEAGLQAMAGMKPPGVSGSRISSLTALCSESVLIQKIFTHFKRAPATHKLGVLYVVDSVTRKWLEQAKLQGQAVDSSAQDGTYAAGVNRVTELMPVLMNDIMSTAPEEHKDKIKKLLDIWEKSSTFPVALIESWKKKLTEPPAVAQNESTTPPGSPPPNAVAAIQSNGTTQANPAPAAPNGTSILEALAALARQKTSAPPSNPAQPAPAAPSYSVPPAAITQPASSSVPPAQPAISYPPAPHPVNMPSLPFGLPQQMPAHAPAAPALPPSLANAFGAVQGAPGLPPQGGQALDQNTQQQIMLIKALADQGVPFDKIPALIQTLTAAGGAGAGPAPPPASAPPNPYGAPAHQPWQPPAQSVQPQQHQPSDPRDRFRDAVRSPPRFGKRSRSRSPDRGWGGRGDRDRGHGQNSPRGDDRFGRRGGDYRQRSPQGRRGRSPSPTDGFPPIERWVEYDSSLPSGHIRVLSRTLFVGGVTVSEAELRRIFSHFGTVQTCIVNREKRHAFVKMLTRKDAVNAKTGTEESKDPDLHFRTRWGVGFGPRDCSDYSTGISVIPIHKLTEADRKWMLTAPYGGSGGQPIESGLSVEEPDIEIGAGVSSKAISRRMQTDKGGSNGPKSTRGRDDDSTRWRRGRDAPNDHMGNHSDRGDHGNQNAGQGGPAFPFGIGTLPNGMPSFPDNFAFPAPGQNKW
ncbi:RNA polymerase II-binding domain-containing protein [Sarocladium implicatum]|nr:RNA polymerase II-binding domain-containing protein [Sarocladium implicatum]